MKCDYNPKPFTKSHKSKNGNWTQMNLKKLALRMRRDEHQIRSFGADFVV